eukprot:gnl/TRDRNA2_/TRDRNA2_47810_c0_seq1.p1 gnl/TRDRNA2_/TRDRNA2_47810_c0~~gnl/TRDRNA2_/TRDRNA2_47810_c0_seq1.p1  ORF type:complete len:179 (+),score=38.53 gnl/TRDRNA2_/TRDRNA2_47810_c0_seq1:2-538(+)
MLMESGDSDAALKWLRKAALQSMPAACHALGEMYINRVAESNDERDVNEASRWFKKGSELYHGPSMVWHSRMLIRGWGMKKDEVAAVDLLRKLDKLPGSPDANGVPEGLNITEASRWLEQQGISRISKLCKQLQHGIFETAEGSCANSEYGCGGSGTASSGMYAAGSLCKLLYGDHGP